MKLEIIEAEEIEYVARRLCQRSGVDPEARAFLGITGRVGNLNASYAPSLADVHPAWEFYRQTALDSIIAGRSWAAKLKPPSSNAQGAQ